MEQRASFQHSALRPSHECARALSDGAARCHRRATALGHRPAGSGSGYRGASTDRDRNGHDSTDRDGHTDRHANSCGGSACYCHLYDDTHLYPIVHGDACAHAFPDADLLANGDSHPYTGAHEHADTNADCHRYPVSDGHFHPAADGHSAAKLPWYARWLHPGDAQFNQSNTGAKRGAAARVEWRGKLR